MNSNKKPKKGPAMERKFEHKIVNQGAEIMGSIGASFPDGLVNSLTTAAECAANLDQGTKQQFDQALDENETIEQAADQVNISIPVAIALCIELDFHRELTDPLLTDFMLKDFKNNPQWLGSDDIKALNKYVKENKSQIGLGEVILEDMKQGLDKAVENAHLVNSVLCDSKDPFINIHKESLARLLGKFGVQAELSQEDIALYFQLRDQLVKAGAWI